jgi:2-phosphosulfolactate phosphatase
MPSARAVHVHLLPSLIPSGSLAGSLAVVIDVLRASTTVVYALASGCTAVLPIAEIEEAREVAGRMRAGKVILGGERMGKPIKGFDLGNSPLEYTHGMCHDAALVLTTTNGTMALLAAVEADRVLMAGFVNFSAICAQLLEDPRPVHIICSGTHGEIALEDTLLAGAFVETLSQQTPTLNDSAIIAWDNFETSSLCLVDALRMSTGGQNLLELGYDRDIVAAAEVDRYSLVPELHRQPLRLEIGSVKAVRSHWPLAPAFGRVGRSSYK